MWQQLSGGAAVWKRDGLADSKPQTAGSVELGEVRAMLTAAGRSDCEQTAVKLRFRSGVNLAAVRSGAKPNFGLSAQQPERSLSDRVHGSEWSTTRCELLFARPHCPRLATSVQQTAVLHRPSLRPRRIGPRWQTYSLRNAIGTKLRDIQQAQSACKLAMR